MAFVIEFFFECLFMTSLIVLSSHMTYRDIVGQHPHLPILPIYILRFKISLLPYYSCTYVHLNPA